MLSIRESGQATQFVTKGLTDRRIGGVRKLMVAAAVVLSLAACAAGQTASTGALLVIALDPSGAPAPGVTVRVEREDGASGKSGETGPNGQLEFLLLQAGAWSLNAGKSGFTPLAMPNIQVPVTETVRVEIHLEVSSYKQQIEVSSRAAMVDLDNAALGRAVSEASLKELPMAARNFTEIATLSPGVVAGVYNAGELGAGGTALAQIGKSNDGIYAHGSRSYDNNWQLDGISVTDVLGASTISGGIPTPNPDTLQEFKVQTGQYDGSFGRGSGANVSVVTKQGGNRLHGSFFEFLRNEDLDANDFFLNETGQRRAELKQNQFGLTLGGPIRKDKLLFFASYQGTRQENGLAAGQSRVACSASLTEPALTNDRSPAALGKLFGGVAGALGGVAVAPDGSNINPVALTLLNVKLPNGSYLIPTPQTVNPDKKIATQGFSVFSEPCSFQDDQFLLNMDWQLSRRNRFSGRFFFAKDSQSVTFPAGSQNNSNVPGFFSPGNSQFLVSSVSHTYQGSSWLSETRFGFVRTVTGTANRSPFKWSDVGVSEGELDNNNELPSWSIVGSVSMASVLPRTYGQDSFELNNVTSFLRGSHTFKLGASSTRFTSALNFNGFGTYVQFLSWPDFLLGLNAAQNGTGTFSNVSYSTDAYGLFNHHPNVREGAVFVQDSYRIVPSLTLTLGLRYDRIGQFGDSLGRFSSFDFGKADKNPGPVGSLAGYIVASNFPGIVPAGVERADNTSATYGLGQNVWAPRLGFAWQVLPKSTRWVVRGGYGIYYSRPPGQTAVLSIDAAPFSISRPRRGTADAGASWQFPFAQPYPDASSFPLFVPYSTSTSQTIRIISPYFQPAMVQQFSLGTQWEVLPGWLLDLGYVGARGLRLQSYRSLNQALSASPGNPVNGVTTNTLANVDQRVPIPGILPDSLLQLQSEGNSWYNGLEASLTKRLAHGVRLLASYTFSKTLDTDGADVNSNSAENAITLGDQNSSAQRWGRASFDRTHRFVLSALAALPGPARGLPRRLLGDWSFSAIATVQSGTALTIAYTNTTNAFGISEDRAQLSGRCAKGRIVNGGSLEPNLNAYFNASCFGPPPVIGSDGIATAFGNSPTGIVSGPPQANLDLSFSKVTSLKWPREGASLQFRAEFYNALNHPQFANPDSNFSSSTFGVVSSTSVNARVGQLALRYLF